MSKTGSKNENNKSSENDGIEYILSLCYEKKHLACAFYKISTAELFVSHETSEIPPYYSYLENLLRLLKPEYCLAAGSNEFLKKILFLLKYPSDAEPDDFRVKNHLEMTSSFLVFPLNRKKFYENYHLILKTQQAGADEDESKNIKFLKTYLPLDQDLVVHALGNLMNFLNTNLKHLWIRQRNGLELILLNDIKLFYLQSHVIITEDALNSLGIFSKLNYSINSKYINDQDSTREELSIYKLLRQNCSSNIGKEMLNYLLRQPTRNIRELDQSYNTIDFLLSLDSIKLRKLRGYLRKLSNLAANFKTISLKPNLSASSWIAFKKTLLNLTHLITYCGEIIINDNVENFTNTYIHVIGENSKEKSKNIRTGLITIDVIVDLEETERQHQFVCKNNFDKDLDRKRYKMTIIQDTIKEAFIEESMNIPEWVREIDGYYIPEVGYVLHMKFDDLEDNENPPPIEQIENDSLKFLVSSGDSYFFKTSLCDKLNETYGGMYYDICEHEQRICYRLIEFLREILPELLENLYNAAKLDYQIAMALLAKQYSLVRPEIHFDKYIEIEEGWHLLSAIANGSTANFIRNSTKISENDENLITIFIAPNSSGKSIYMKQIGLIFYLAHIGCFVPAKSAKLFLLDSIYTCMYVPDSINLGYSSFYSDLQQILRIIINSEERSLAIIDEFGSGTNPEEGEALLASSVEALIQKGPKLCPITLISTHFLEISKFINENCDDDDDDDNDNNGNDDNGNNNKNNDGERKRILSYKTFENQIISNGKNSMLMSTYKLLDGKCNETNYAMRINGIKQILDKIFTIEEEEGDCCNDNEDSVNELNYERLTKKSRSLTQSRVKNTYGVIKEYLKNNDDFDEIYEKILQIFLKE